MATPVVLGSPINSRLGLPHLSGQTVLDTENALRTLGGGPSPVFSRASVAYRSDGSQVATGVPRLERGRWHNMVPRRTATVADLHYADGVEAVLEGIRFPDNTRTRAGYAEVKATKAGGLYQGRCKVKMDDGGVPSPGNDFTLVCGGQTFMAYLPSAHIGDGWYLVSSTPAVIPTTPTWYTGVIKYTGQTPRGFVVKDFEQFDTVEAPRFFLPGGYGERGAVWCEEGTTNLVADPVFQNGLASWMAWNAAGVIASEVVSDTLAIGGKSYHVVSSQVNGGVRQVAIPIVGGTTYTLTVYGRRVSGLPKAGQLTFNGAVPYSSPSPAMVGTNRTKWTLTVTAAADATIAGVYLGGSTDNAQAEAYYDGIQLEPEPYATSFTATTRAAEVISQDIRTLLRPSEGAVTGLWYEDGQAVGQHHLFDTDGADRLRLYRDGANWVAEAAGVSLTFAKPSVGWHDVAFWWEGKSFGVIVDGVAKGAGALSKPLADIGAKLYLGCDKNGGNQWNERWQTVRPWWRRPSVAECVDLTRYGPLLGVA
jgi:hypothetical protein